MFGGPSPTPPEVTPPTPMGLSPGAEEGFMRFLLKNNGVLFENEMLQIGVKSEYKKNLGQFITCTVYVKIMTVYTVYYSCFSPSFHPFSNHSLPRTLPSRSLSPPSPPPPPPHTHKPGRIGVFYGNKSATSLQHVSSSVTVSGPLEESLNVQSKPIDSTIENGAQVQQVINVECKAPFYDAPLLNVQFR